MAFCTQMQMAAMHQGTQVFAQVMAYLLLSTFRHCVAAHNGERKVREFSCLDPFLTMAFANRPCAQKISSWPMR